MNFRSRTNYSVAKFSGTTHLQCSSMRCLRNLTKFGTPVPYLNNSYIKFDGTQKGLDQLAVYNLLQNKLKTVVLTFGVTFAN